MLASIKFSHTKNPRPGSTATKYAMFDLEDTAGMMRCILWPEEFANYGQLVKADAILVVRGAIDQRPGSEEANLIVNELIPLVGSGRPAYTRGVLIRVDEEPHGVRGLEQLYEILRGYPGQLRVATGPAPGRRQPGDLRLRGHARRAEHRDAQPRRRSAGPGQPAPRRFAPEANNTTATMATATMATHAPAGAHALAVIAPTAGPCQCATPVDERTNEVRYGRGTPRLILTQLAFRRLMLRRS